MIFSLAAFSNRCKRLYIFWSVIGWCLLDVLSIQLKWLPLLKIEWVRRLGSPKQRELVPIDSYQATTTGFSFNVRMIRRSWVKQLWIWEYNDTVHWLCNCSIVICKFLELFSAKNRFINFHQCIGLSAWYITEYMQHWLEVRSYAWSLYLYRLA